MRRGRGTIGAGSHSKPGVVCYLVSVSKSRVASDFAIDFEIEIEIAIAIDFDFDFDFESGEIIRIEMA